MSPEQVSGKPVDHRTDVFSFGALLYEMASGRRPFQGASRRARLGYPARHAPGPPEHPRRPARELTRVVARCLEKDPAARFQGWGRSSRAARPVTPGARRGRAHGRLGAARAPGRRRRPDPAGRGGVPRDTARARAPGSGAPRDAPASGAIRSIAVLPLDNYSGDAGQDYFAEGMTDELTAQLATISRSA